MNPTLAGQDRALVVHVTATALLIARIIADGIQGLHNPEDLANRGEECVQTAEAMVTEVEHLARERDELRDGA